MILDFPKWSRRALCQGIRLVRKSKPFFLDCSGGPFSLSYGDKYTVREAPISVLLFPCPLITVAARCPEADASPTGCQERKKTHCHWLLYLEWFLNPSKKTTVRLASRQLESTGAGSTHSPKSTWLGRRGGWRTKKGAFHSEKFISFKYLQSAADSAGGHLALFPHKREGWVVVSRCWSGLWREVHHPSRISILTVLVSLWWKFALLKQQQKKVRVVL